jgi:uncharacterized cupin superfamily protein
MRPRPNAFNPDLDNSPDRGSDREGFRCRGITYGPIVGSQRLGMSLYELPPGQRSVPYHWHTANEEMLIALRGTVSLRTPDGWRELPEGALVSFPRGERGAHQMRNDTSEPIRFLMVSELRSPEVVVYPDSDKVGARDWETSEGLRLNWRAGDAVDYWEGED